MARLDRLGHASSKADEGPRESAGPHRLGRDPVVRTRGRPAPAPPPSERLRLGRVARHRARDRAALRARRREARRDRLLPQRPRPPRRRPRSCARSAPSRRSCAATSRSDRVLDEVAALGPLDVLVHNAASGVSEPALETEAKHWDWTMNTNARALLAARAASRRRRCRTARRSSRSRRSARSACSRTTRSSARRRRRSRRSSATSPSSSRRGIRVNAVSGGVVETDALEHFPNREEMLAAGAANPVGRMVEPDDIAAAVAFLCSPDADDGARPDADRRRRLLAPRLSVHPASDQVRDLRDRA